MAKSKAGAPKGNTNALKWTEEKAIALYDQADSIVKRKCDYVVFGKKIKGYEFDFIGELADELDVYRDLIAEHLPDQYPFLKDRFNKLKNRLETNCYSNTKKGIINTAVGIVNLKSNHNWSDKTTVDHQSKGEKINLPIINWAKNDEPK